MVFCNENKEVNFTVERESHNPYFNRWFSAIRDEEHISDVVDSHNPYFNRWFSAILKIQI